MQEDELKCTQTPAPSKKGEYLLKQIPVLSEEQISYMADRFCGWRLPEGFNPDGGITFEPIGSKGTPHEFKREPTGTNVFTHEQAKEMIRYMIQGLE